MITSYGKFKNFLSDKFAHRMDNGHSVLTGLSVRIYEENLSYSIVIVLQDSPTGQPIFRVAKKETMQTSCVIVLF